MKEITEESSKDVYNDVLNKFLEWPQLPEKCPLRKGSRTWWDTYYRDAYFLCRIETDLTFDEALNDDDGEKKALSALEKHFTLNPTKTIKDGTGTPYVAAKGYLRSLRLLKDFLKEYPGLKSEVLSATRYAARNKSKIKDNEINKPNHNKAQEPSKNKPISPIPPINPPPEPSHSDKPHEIVHRAMEKITEINQNCKNHKKDLIFKKEVHELSRIIENPCTSRELFINFSLKLYIMICETTRKKSNNVNNDKRKPYYDFLLPYEFYRKGTDTRYFMDMVGTLRHHYAHLEPEYIEQIDKIPYEDVLKELLMNKEEPTSKEDFQKLQIAVLEKFEASMKRLLEIVKSELNPPKTH